MRRGLILKEDELREVVDYFITKDKFAFDIETYGPNRSVFHLAPISWISMATDGVGVTIPFAHPIGSKIIGERPEYQVYKTGKRAGLPHEKPTMVPVYEDPPPQIGISPGFEILRPLFFRPGIIKTGHNIIGDLVGVHKYFGETPPLPYGDTITKQWLLNENLLKKDLKTLSKFYWGAVYDTEETGKCVEKHPLDKVAYYSYCDSVYTYLLDNRLDPQITEQGLNEVYELEMGVLHALVGMKLHGAKVDVPKIEELRDVLIVKVTEAESEVYRTAGKKFNINSTPQKQQILYMPKSEGGQGLKPWKLTKTGKSKKEKGFPVTIKDYSTDASVLESYPGNPVAKALGSYQEVSKLLNTYVLGWLGDGDEKPCVIYEDHLHADFVQYGTVTGRFSCREPNLQNIPRPYTELGQLLRGVFVPEENGKLVIADYAQIELVILAHYLGQGKLYDAFMQGIDPHTQTAAMVLGKKPEDVTKVERQDLGKTLGFAVVYGAGLDKVANMAKISLDEAKRVLATHERMFPEIYGYKDYVINKARTRKPEPYLTTLSGRRRRIAELNSPVNKIRMGAERQAFNSLIQGGAADLIKTAMIRVDNMLPSDVKLIMTVHDELILAAPDHMVQEAATILTKAMTGSEIQSLVKVPLKADVHIADRWSEAK